MPLTPIEWRAAPQKAEQTNARRLTSADLADTDAVRLHDEEGAIADRGKEHDASTMTRDTETQPCVCTCVRRCRQ
jgi:hypothetical protein